MTPALPVPVCRPARHAFGQSVSGSALVVSLLMMLLIALLGISMMRTQGLEARIAGNTSEKQHSFQAAQTALQYGEWWLTQADNASTGVQCASSSSAPVVCANLQSQASLTTSSWSSFGAPYVPPSVNGASALNVSTSGGAGNYFATPQLYVAYLGTSANQQGRLYQVTAIGYGGNANAVSVVQSTYAVSCLVCDTGGL